MFGKKVTLTMAERVAELKAGSDSIMDVFTSTRNQLMMHNEEISSVQDEIAEKMNELNDQQNVLTRTAVDNDKVINKIDDFLS